MTETDIERLNAAHSVPGHITFAAEPGGLALAHIRNAHGSGSLSLQGGQLLAYQPRGAAPVLWASEQAMYAPGRAIRGGIPICWPWFGPHPADPHKPAHGFARTAAWDVLEASSSPGGASTLRLRLADSDATRALWPHAFELRLTVILGAQLRVELGVRNPGREPFSFTGALHTYIGVGDITSAQVLGLEGAPFVDKVDGGARRVQQGPVRFAGEVDRVYLDTEATCVVEDPALGRRVEVAKSGSRSTVVWNPWAEKARRLADLGDDEYRTMLCVETANAEDDQVTVAPGGEHRLVAMITAR